MKEQSKILPWTSVLTPKWKTDLLTKGLSKTNISHYVSRQTTVVLLLTTPQKDRRGVLAKKKKERKKKNRLSDVHIFFNSLVFEMGILKAFFCSSLSSDQQIILT